ADQVLFYNQNAWQTSWLELSAQRHEWRPVGDVTQPSADGRVIVPGTAVMFKSASDTAASYVVTGHVRTGAFVRPLDQTHNLLALPWPVDTTPQQLKFDATQGFTSGKNSSVADQIQLYNGDETANAITYAIYWLRQSGTTGIWSPKADASAPDVSATLRLPAHRGFFLKIMPRSGESVWKMPALQP
ncbi:MAG TPA: hypothetical protein VGE29_16270, partial [Prosthecobacter sp.]